MVLLLAAALGCREQPMVSTKLVDGRANASSFGWRFYQVEVHQGRMAPLMGLDRLWRRFDRLDTVPHIRSLGAVAVVGDTLVIGVGGTSSTAWAYDVRTRELTRSPAPDWFNRAWMTPPAALSPDGRFIAYVALDYDTTRVTVRSWPAGRIVWQSAPVHPRQLPPPRGGRIVWANAEQFEVELPVTDSGPSIASIGGRISSDRVDIARWQIYPDFEDPEVRRLMNERAVRASDSAVAAGRAAASSGASATPGADTSIQARFARAAQQILRRPPSAFPELPPAFRSELEQLGCTIPQLEAGEGHWNVIEGEFAARGQKDWAALCSRNDVSAIILHWGGPVHCPRELAAREDREFLQGMGGGRIEFSRVIGKRNSYHVYADQDSGGPDRDVQLEHDGIEDAFMGKASTVRFCRNGTWLAFSGAD